MNRIKVMVLGRGIKAGIYEVHQRKDESDMQTIKRHFGSHVNLIGVLERK